MVPIRPATTNGPRRVALGTVALAAGAYLFYAGVLHNPLAACRTAVEIAVTGGAHLGPDGAIDYYWRDSCYPYPNADRVFYLVTLLSLGLLTAGVYAIRSGRPVLDR